MIINYSNWSPSAPLAKMTFFLLLIEIVSYHLATSVLFAYKYILISVIVFK